MSSVPVPHHQYVYAEYLALDFTHTVFGPGQRVALDALGCELDADDLYRAALS